MGQIITLIQSTEDLGGWGQIVTLIESAADLVAQNVRVGGPCLSEGDSWGQGVFGARRAGKRYRLQEVYLASFFPYGVALKHHQRIQVSYGIGLKVSGFKISVTSRSEIT